MCHFTIIQARIITSWQLCIPSMYQLYNVSGTYAAFLLMDYTDIKWLKYKQKKFYLVN